MKSSLPPYNGWFFRIADYLGSTFSIIVTSEQIQVTVQSIGIYPLQLIVNTTGKIFHLTRRKYILEYKLPKYLLQIKRNTILKSLSIFDPTS